MQYYILQPITLGLPNIDFLHDQPEMALSAEQLQIMLATMENKAKVLDQVNR